MHFYKRVTNWTYFLVHCFRDFWGNMYTQLKCCLQPRICISSHFPAVLLFAYSWPHQGKWMILNQLWNHMSLYWWWKWARHKMSSTLLRTDIPSTLGTELSISRQPDLLNGCQVCTENLVLPKGIGNNLWRFKWVYLSTCRDHLGTSSAWYSVIWVFRGLQWLSKAFLLDHRP